MAGWLADVGIFYKLVTKSAVRKFEIVSMDEQKYFRAAAAFGNDAQKFHVKFSYVCGEIFKLPILERWMNAAMVAAAVAGGHCLMRLGLSPSRRPMDATKEELHFIPPQIGKFGNLEKLKLYLATRKSFLSHPRNFVT